MASDSEIIAEARKIILEEARAVSSLADGIGAAFATAARLILELPPSGRVVVTGLGKAGFVAQKLSATLASTGTSSFYLHPAEALHGDIGRFHRNDLALILSNSGETEEIVRLVPMLKRLGTAIISITGTENSTLARHSDAALLIGTLKEAGELGLAPTSSTAAMMAMGDALALVIVKQRGFTKEQFAFNHPAGNLGRKLMKVSELMRVGDEHCVLPEDTLTRDVLHKISKTKGRPGAAALTDRNNKLSGIFTDGNLRRCLESGAAFLEQPISNVMTRNPKIVGKENLVTEALKLLTMYSIDQLIVVDAENHPVGLIDIQDLVGWDSSLETSRD